MNLKGFLLLNRNKLLLAGIIGIGLFALGYCVVDNLFGNTANKNGMNAANTSLNIVKANNIVELKLIPPVNKNETTRPRTVKNPVSATQIGTNRTKQSSSDTRITSQIPIVDQAAICLSVQQQEPVNKLQEVSAKTRKIYCWARILNGRGKQIRYIWYINQTAYPSQWLYINNDRFRTWCPKYIPAGTKGSAKVEIVDQTGRVLKSLDFQINPKKTNANKQKKRG